MPERIQYDVILVGGSPSNLALAHRLVDLAKESGQQLTMAIFEKGKDFGSHIISGAVSNPRVIKKLFPDYQEQNFPIEAVCEQSWFSVLGQKNKWDVPSLLVPPGMKKEGYFVLTLSHVVYWMVSRLKDKLKEVPHVEVDFFPGFSAHEIIFDEESKTNPNRVIGVQVAEQGNPNAESERAYARVTCFGDKGFISKHLINRLNLRDTQQVWSVGVKETWELTPENACPGKVWHTMGYPMVDGTFGGGFVYGMKDNKLTIGMVISLDSENPNINPQQCLQNFKKHPWLQTMLKGAKLIKYGAAVLPEGGYYALPKNFAVDGAFLLGDALGVLDISTLSGIDKGMESGYQAAEVIHKILKSNGDFAGGPLEEYKKRVMDSFVGKEMYAGRYFRYAWQENPRLLKNYLPKVLEGVDNGTPIMGVMFAGLNNNIFQAMGDALRLKNLMEGTTDIGPVRYKHDFEYIVPDFKPIDTVRVDETKVAKDTIYSRADAVFYAHTKYHEENRHIDEFNADVCMKCIARYDNLHKDVPCVSDCTAEVHRIDVVQDLRKHGMSLENCVQCRTCEMVCPEMNLNVRPTAQGSGPDFMGL